MAVYIYKIKGASHATFGEFDGVEDLIAHIHCYDDEFAKKIGLSNTHFVWDCALHKDITRKVQTNDYDASIYDNLKIALERSFLSEKEFKENVECLEAKNGK